MVLYYLYERAWSRIVLNRALPRSFNAKHRAAMTWTQRLKRVFNIDIETCEARSIDRDDPTTTTGGCDADPRKAAYAAYTQQLRATTD